MSTNVNQCQSDWPHATDYDDDGSIAFYSMVFTIKTLQRTVGKSVEYSMPTKGMTISSPTVVSCFPNLSGTLLRKVAARGSIIRTNNTNASNRVAAWNSLKYLGIITIIDDH